MDKFPAIPATIMRLILATSVTIWLVAAFIVLSPLSASAASNDNKTKLSSPSTTAQRLYLSAQNDLLQLRILTKNGRAQSAIGSGFMVGTSNLIVTNYHVVADLALKPKIYTGEYLGANGKSGSIELLAVDVLNDLAVVRTDQKGTGFFTVPEQPQSLKQGQYLYSLGNPLDLGFTISEGSYNGIIRRSFYDELMFTGPINAGMSGGPCITANGQLAGVNVSVRTDGQLVSFIVPAKYVQALLKKAAAITKPVKKFDDIVGQQLLEHQAMMLDKVLAAPLTIKTLGKYRAPVRESDQMRCWGDSSDNPKSLFKRENVQCSMESNIYVSNELRTGDVSILHQLMHTTKLDPLRFSRLATSSINNNNFGNHKNKNLTGPKCTEQFLNNSNLSMRVVLCIRAYKKFAGLYDFTLVTDTVDEPLMNLESRLDAKGVSFDNGLRITKTFIESIGREKKP